MYLFDHSTHSIVLKLRELQSQNLRCFFLYQAIKKWNNNYWITTISSIITLQTNEDREYYYEYCYRNNPRCIFVSHFPFSLLFKYVRLHNFTTTVSVVFEQWIMNKLLKIFMYNYSTKQLRFISNSILNF